MIYGAALIFDEQTETVLRGGWQAVANSGASAFMLGLDYPPHLTFFVAEGADIAALRPVVRGWAAQAQPVELAFHSLGTFNSSQGVVYLAPRVDQALLDLHAGFWAHVQPHVTGASAHYLPGTWTPHVTLGINIPLEMLAVAVEALRAVTLPHTGTACGLIYGSFEPGGHSHLETILLGQGEHHDL